MAKTSAIHRDIKRRRLVARDLEKRKALRAIIVDPEKSDEERIEAQRKLSKLPRNSNPVRVRNRCNLTGRPRGNLRKFGLCRIQFRGLSLLGEIPGVRKASW